MKIRQFTWVKHQASSLIKVSAFIILFLGFSPLSAQINFNGGWVGVSKDLYIINKDKSGNDVGIKFPSRSGNSHYEYTFFSRKDSEVLQLRYSGLRSSAIGAKQIYGNEFINFKGASKELEVKGELDVHGSAYVKGSNGSGHLGVATSLHTLQAKIGPGYGGGNSNNFDYNSRSLHVAGNGLRVDKNFVLVRTSPNSSSVTTDAYAFDINPSGDFRLLDYGNQQDNNNGDIRLQIGSLGNVSIPTGLVVGGTNPVAGATAHFDGRVYISENGGSETGFNNQSDNKYLDYLLWVEEGIVSKDFAIAETSEWPDYVFDKDYELSSLKELDAFIQQKGHLPSMPSAQEVESEGYSLGDMDKRLLKTLEELTLYTIDQEKQIQKQQDLIQSLLARIEKLEQEEK